METDTILLRKKWLLSLILAGGEACFEQHVENLSGQGLPRTQIVSKSENFLEARISSLGKFERCCEKQAKAPQLKG
jgi:hypothetical protein